MINGLSTFYQIKKGLDSKSNPFEAKAKILTVQINP
jgi:hypothetical protein